MPPRAGQLDFRLLVKSSGVIEGDATYRFSMPDCGAPMASYL